MTYDIQVLKMGQCEVPGPEVYWISGWDTWETLHFWMVSDLSCFILDL